MIEWVAKSIYEKRNGAGCKPWSIQTKAHKEPYLADARAAIEAMREPTEKMQEAGVEAYANGDPNDAVSLSGIGDAWRAMVDAALSRLP